jgi:hypothetical protein
VQHNVKDLRDQLTGPHTGVFDAWSSTLILDESHMARIGRQLKSAADDAEDTLLVYYSGHGCLDSRRNELYLALRETHPDSLGFSAIHIDVLREAIQSSNAANKILVLDCCFSGKAVESLSDRASAVEGQIALEGTLTLTSASGSNVAVVLPGERNTAFTGRLLKILREGSPATGNPLNLNALYQQLMQTMLNERLPKPRRLGSGNVGDLVLSRGGGRPQPALPMQNRPVGTRIRPTPAPTRAQAPEAVVVEPAVPKAKPVVYQGSQPPAPRGTSIKDRQRAAARARLEKEMAERAAADRRRRQWQALMGSALFVILAVLLVWWLAAR